jgi:hypothetical protein
VHVTIGTQRVSPVMLENSKPKPEPWAAICEPTETEMAGGGEPRPPVVVISWRKVMAAVHPRSEHKRGEWLIGVLFGGFEREREGWFVVACPPTTRRGEGGRNLAKLARGWWCFVSSRGWPDETCWWR